MKKAILATILLLFALPAVAEARQGHTTLLTVGERNNETFGGTADLYLDIKPGSGRVFIDSFPLSRIDTQISTRYAKDVACNFLDMDCTKKDFFYTIRTGSSVVGGPSAGASTALLTISLLDNTKLDRDIVMTGTINSGGIIGPVAGIEEKAIAARNAGFKKILVPKWSILERGDPELNETTIYADALEVEGIEIVLVSTIEEALYEFTGVEYEDYQYDITIPEEYQEIMGDIAKGLCERYDIIASEIPEELLMEYNESVNATNEAMNNGLEAMERRDYYSAASFCFTANTGIRRIQYENYSVEQRREVADMLMLEILAEIANINNQPINTLSDLETVIIVKERLLEAQNILRDENALDQVGYAKERFFSAKAWSRFLDYGAGAEVVLDESHLSSACLTKIAEAEERINYLEIMFPLAASDYREDLVETQSIQQSGDYAFCIFRATRTKADANAVLSATAVSREKISELINDKLALARAQINRQGENFPILGYSYYDYANSLQESRPELSIVFSEYAAEFSNLDMYFPRKDTVSRRDFQGLPSYFYFGFFLGMTIGIFLAGTIIATMVKRHNRKRKRKMIKTQRDSRTRS